jgi:hypothetical protein
MLQKLKMLQLLQLQLGDSCNCNGLRNSRMIGCKGAGGRPSPPPSPERSLTLAGRGSKCDSPGCKREMLQMLQLLQLQLGDSCNCNGLRNSRMIGCKGAAGGWRTPRWASLPIRIPTIAQNEAVRVTFCLLLRHKIGGKKNSTTETQRRRKERLNRQGRQERQDHTEGAEEILTAETQRTQRSYGGCGGFSERLSMKRDYDTKA